MLCARIFFSESGFISRQDAKLAKVRIYFPILKFGFLGVLCAFARDIPILGCVVAALCPPWRSLNGAQAHPTRLSILHLRFSILEIDLRVNIPAAPPGS
jgi:hypothetical protein